jgi:hypothetical protein
MRRFATYVCGNCQDRQEGGKVGVMTPTETMRVWEYLSRVNGEASPQQIKTAIFKEYGKRVELQRISQLRRLWFESSGREAPALRNGKSSVPAAKTKKGKAKKVASSTNQRTKK